jgi:hypothetical protein
MVPLKVKIFIWLLAENKIIVMGESTTQRSQGSGHLTSMKK